MQMFECALARPLLFIYYVFVAATTLAASSSNIVSLVNNVAHFQKPKLELLLDETPKCKSRLWPVGTIGAGGMEL